MKFFRFTIQGDSFNPDYIKQLLNIPCSVYYKGEETVHKIGEKSFFIKQSTNRWVYSEECLDKERIDGFLSRNLRVIYSIIDKITPYICDSKMLIELIIYTDKKSVISISKKQAELLHKIGVKFNIVFA